MEEKAVERKRNEAIIYRYGFNIVSKLLIDKIIEIYLCAYTKDSYLGYILFLKK
tara:strand:+ start:102 stop:263 length:162 start_codon:yes stop_codon:yes gene_type:complete